MICRICRQKINFREIPKTLLRAKICGVVPYGLCLCGMEVLPELNDRNYKNRWERAFRRVYFDAGPGVKRGKNR